MRFISKKDEHANRWEIFKYTNDETRAQLVGAIWDKETHDILMHAPAEVILAKVLKRVDKKHYHASRSSSLSRFQSAFVNFLRRL